MQDNANPKDVRDSSPLLRSFWMAPFLLAFLFAISPAFANSITKEHARTMFHDNVHSDPDYANDPVKQELAICAFDGALDEAFGTATTLNETTFMSRMAAATERFKHGSENKDPVVMLQLMRCLVNSQAVEQAMKDKSEQEPSSRARSPAYALLDMDDLRLDMVSLVGKKVRTQGVGYYMMDMFLLKKSMTDLSPIFIDISKLQRDQRRQIMQRCGDIMNGCRVTIQGEVGKVSYQNGLIAEYINW